MFFCRSVYVWASASIAHRKKRLESKHSAYEKHTKISARFYSTKLNHTHCFFNSCMQRKLTTL